MIRGSQYRVESMLLRMLKPNDYIAASFSKIELQSQIALLQKPLIMEPITKFYVDPIIVLDFRSLYPSIIIAYNLCYSTIYGKLTHLTSKKKRIFSKISCYRSYIIIRY